MIDENGYRENIGIIITNYKGEVFWAKRIGQESWQFPQGGINDNETPEDAMYRELYEEIGLQKKDVSIIASTKSWLYYRLPKKLQRPDSQPLCIGQKQKWYLLKLITDQKFFKLDASGKPEFDDWKWVSYWYPLRHVINFKRDVYRKALFELSSQKCKLILDPIDTSEK